MASAFAMAWAMAAGASHASPLQGDRDRDFQAQDARLNAAYQALAGSLDDAHRKQLRDEERQWIVTRDRDCGKDVAGTPEKNECSVMHTARRADELEQRLASAPATIGGAYGYRSDCGFGHYAQFEIEKGAPDYAGTWSDGTRTGGDSGRFQGHVRNGKLYVKFCTDEGKQGFPSCPSFDADDDAYVVQGGATLTWFRPVGTGAASTFEKYLVMHRVKPGAKAPLDARCEAEG